MQSDVFGKKKTDDCSPVADPSHCDRDTNPDLNRRIKYLYFETFLKKRPQTALPPVLPFPSVCVADLIPEIIHRTNDPPLLSKCNV